MRAEHDLMALSAAMAEIWLATVSQISDSSVHRMNGFQVLFSRGGAGGGGGGAFHHHHVLLMSVQLNPRIESTVSLQNLKH